MSPGRGSVYSAAVSVRGIFLVLIIRAFTTRISGSEPKSLRDSFMRVLWAGHLIVRQKATELTNRCSTFCKRLGLLLSRLNGASRIGFKVYAPKSIYK